MKKLVLVSIAVMIVSIITTIVYILIHLRTYCSGIESMVVPPTCTTAIPVISYIMALMAAIGLILIIAILVLYFTNRQYLEHFRAYWLAALVISCFITFLTYILVIEASSPYPYSITKNEYYRSLAH